MAGYPRRIGEDNQVFQKAVFITANTTLTVQQRVVVTSGAITVGLPSVAESIGMIFTISNETGSAQNATISDAGDAVHAISITLTNTNRIALLSDGRQWHTIASTL